MEIPERRISNLLKLLLFDQAKLTLSFISFCYLSRRTEVIVDSRYDSKADGKAGCF